MEFKNIDELIKAGLMESERRGDPLAHQAKERIWKSVEKPGRKQAIPWGFVSALAACFSLFLICILLFMKTNSQQKELNALRAFVNLEKQPSDSLKETAQEPKPELEVAQSEPIAVPSQNRNPPGIPLPQNPKPTEVSPTEPGGNKADLKIIMIPIESEKPNIEKPDIFIGKLVEELTIPKESKERVLSKPGHKKPGKIKFRFGTGSQTYDQPNSLALNIKF